MSQAVRTFQIIVGALTMGLLTFAAITYFLRAGKPPAAPAIPWFIPLGFAGAGLVAARLIPASLDAGSCRAATQGWPESGEPKAEQVEASRASLLMAYQTRTIIRCALLEGPGFFCLISYMTGGDVSSLFLGLALAAAVASNFPTATRVEAWVETQLDRAREARQFA
jgi:hypothetical protein